MDELRAARRPVAGENYLVFVHNSEHTNRPLLYRPRCLGSIRHLLTAADRRLPFSNPAPGRVFSRSERWCDKIVCQRFANGLTGSCFEFFVWFFGASVPWRHLMQSLPHFGLAAGRTTFYAFTIKDQTDFFHLGFGCKIGAASLAGFEFDRTDLPLWKYFKKPFGIYFMPQFRCTFRADTDTRPAAYALEVSVFKNPQIFMIVGFEGFRGAILDTWSTACA